MDIAHFDPALRQRTAYTFWVKDHVRFTDLDALGHVSAVRTNEFFNGVRATLFHQTIEGWPRSSQLPVLKMSIIEHIQEGRFPDGLDIGMVIENFGRTSVTAALGVFNASGCLAISRNIFVFIDAQTRSPVSPSEAIKDAFIKRAGGPMLKGEL